MIVTGVVKLDLPKKTKEQLEEKVLKGKGSNKDKTTISAMMGEDNLPRYISDRNFDGMDLLL